MRQFTTIVSPLVLIAVLLSACVGSDTQPLVEEVSGLRSDVDALTEQVAGLESGLTAATAPSNEAPSTATTLAEATTTTTMPAPTTTSPDANTGRLAVEFFVASETLCIEHADLTGNPPPDQTRYGSVEVVEALDSDRVVIRDGLGYQLIVDFSNRPVTIYSIGGPDDVLPFDLSFGCPPGLYLGTLPS